MEGRYTTLWAQKTDENLPDQDLSSTTESNFNDVNAETSESDSQDDFSSDYSTGTSTDTEQNNHNGSVVNEQGDIMVLL